MASTTAIPPARIGARTPGTRAKKPAGFHQSMVPRLRALRLKSGAGEVIGRDFPRRPAQLPIAARRTARARRDETRTAAISGADPQHG